MKWGKNYEIFTAENDPRKNGIKWEKKESSEIFTAENDPEKQE